MLKSACSKGFFLMVIIVMLFENVGIHFCSHFAIYEHLSEVCTFDYPFY
jgi:hypothetical protein